MPEANQPEHRAKAERHTGQKTTMPPESVWRCRREERRRGPSCRPRVIRPPPTRPSKGRTIWPRPLASSRATGVLPWRRWPRPRLQTNAARPESIFREPPAVCRGRENRQARPPRRSTSRDDAARSAEDRPDRLVRGDPSAAEPDAGQRQEGPSPRRATRRGGPSAQSRRRRREQQRPETVVESFHGLSLAANRLAAPTAPNEPSHDGRRCRQGEQPKRSQAKPAILHNLDVGPGLLKLLHILAGLDFGPESPSISFRASATTRDTANAAVFQRLQIVLLTHVQDAQRLQIGHLLGEGKILIRRKLGRQVPQVVERCFSSDESPGDLNITQEFQVLQGTNFAGCFSLFVGENRECLQLCEFRQRLHVNHARPLPQEKEMTQFREF